MSSAALAASLLFRAGVPVAPPAPSSVAIIMRTKNRPILLRRALASVIGQSFTRWHLHVVNDGGERAVVDDLVTAHRPALGDRVTVLHNARSLGMEAASNQALAAAKATCFTVHDDDDTWEPEFLAATVGFLDAPENASLVGVTTACTNVFERIEQDRIVIERREPNGGITKFADIAQLLVLNRALPICLLFRMSLVAQLGGFNPDLPVIGDWEFNIRALLVGEIGMIARPLASYHTRRAPPSPAYGNSMTDGREAHIRYDRLLRNSVVRRGMNDHPELLGVLQPVLHAINAAREQTIAHINHAAAAIIAQQRDASAQLLEQISHLQVQHEEVIVARIVAALRATLPAA